MTSHFPIYEDGLPYFHHYHPSIRNSFEHDYKRKLKRTEASYIRTRSAANLRERRRMQCINEAFEGLRNHIPTLPYEKRLSKVDTLRLAICYINFLTELVGSSGENPDINGNFITTQLSNGPGKIVIYSATKDEQERGLPPLRGHSLSWSSETSSHQKLRHVKTKEIWHPEIPVLSKNNIC